MTHPSDEVMLAAGLGGCESVLALAQLARRYQNEYRRTRSVDIAFTIARTYYELPPGFPGRQSRVRSWLRRSICGRPEDAFPRYLMGCVALDETRREEALREFEQIEPDAFSRLSVVWAWRDTKVLELLCTCALYLGDEARLRRYCAAYTSALERSDQVDIPAPHELVFAALSSGFRSRELLGVLRLHADIGWEGDLGADILTLLNAEP